MSDDDIPATDDVAATLLLDAHAEIRRLRARIVELEAELAMAAGTMAQTQEQHADFSVEDVPPSTPR